MQRLRICLPIQGTQVQALVQEDPSRACEPQVLSLHATTTEACMPEPVLRNKRSHCNEKPVHRNKD